VTRTKKLFGGSPKLFEEAADLKAERSEEPPRPHSRKVGGAPKLFEEAADLTAET
jgi:hypothetical protein